MRRSLSSYATYRRTLRAAAISCVLALAVMTLACGDGRSPTQPDPAMDVSGTWRGSVTSASGLSAAFMLVVTQTGGTVSGSFTCSSFTCISSTGTVSGTVSGSAVRGAITFPTGGGCSTFNGNVTGNQFAGSYACQTPFSSDQGTFSASRGSSGTTAPQSCNVSLGESVANVDPAGGARVLAVQTSSPSCAWQSTSSASWVRITSGATGTGSGSVSYVVEANAAAASREASITISGPALAAASRLTVRQAGSPSTCRYCPSPPNRTVSGTGGTFSVTVAPVDSSLEWTAATDQPSWLRIISGSRGRGRGTVTYVVDRNGFGASRTGTISVGGLSGVYPRETHVVTQQR
ncbi:MAG: BACON domain-containing protein [Acidobacteria bacterium]|nr:BACON domain-containing protein [Acidobacteriota bacterium]